MTVLSDLVVPPNMCEQRNQRPTAWTRVEIESLPSCVVHFALRREVYGKVPKLDDVGRCLHAVRRVHTERQFVAVGLAAPPASQHYEEQPVRYDDCQA
jgi:hypothetical protein